MRRRSVLLFLFAVVIGALAFLYDPRNLFDDEESSSATAPETAEVTSSALRETVEVDATLQFAERASIYVRADDRVDAPTTVTALVDEGATIERGNLLWRIGNTPTVALYGPIPAHRTLGEGDVGEDVRQLEENLVALGHDPDGDVVIDEEFDDATEALVARWQEAIGVTATGEVAFGTVVFIDGPRQVGDVSIAVGDEVADATLAMELHDVDREVVIALSPNDRDILASGDAVTVTLPDRTRAEATVTDIDTGIAGGQTVTATVESVSSDATELPVTVSWERPLTDGVLTVPATALVRTDDGVYNVHVLRADGAFELVAVTTGAIADGQVEVTGPVALGDRVLAP
ncbi:MAG: peptidoglycan-binding protein [Actinomycetota bacterium]